MQNALEKHCKAEQSDCALVLLGYAFPFVFEEYQSGMGTSLVNSPDGCCTSR